MLYKLSIQTSAGVIVFRKWKPTNDWRHISTPLVWRYMACYREKFDLYQLVMLHIPYI